MEFNSLFRRTGVTSLQSTICIVGLMFALSATGSISHLAAQEPETASIPELIRRLESRTFVERETATQQLVDSGSATLRPLARNLGDASPETVYRSRKIIQEIAKSGDESTFLKSAAILKLVSFGTLQDNFDVMLALENEWKSRRTEIAADALREMGAEVQLAKDEIEIAGGGLNPLRMSVVSYPSRLPKKTVKRPKRLTKLEFQKAIDSVLVGSIDRNRELVFGAPETEELNSVTQTTMDQIRAQEIWRERRAFADDTAFGLFGNKATIGLSWTGDSSAFAQLAAIENLTELRLQGLSITSDYTRVLKRLSTLERVEIRNCQITDDELKELAKLTTIKHLKIVRQTNVTQFLSALQKSPNLRGIEIADCDCRNGELAQLAQCEKLVQVFLTGLDVPADALKEIGNLDRLRYMSMKSCSFDVAAFQNLKESRPNVTFTTVARAFLGVRGPIAFGDAGSECKISEVISESGADKAGVIVGDVITKINGHDIKVFNDLILYISQHDIGDGLELEVIRDGKKMRLSAELGERDPNIQ
jgi:hypothetical protein